jgi:hypothetical protein
MAKKLLVEGYRPSGREVSAERGYQGGYKPAAPATPSRPPVPPKATSAIAKPKSGK